jgi:hypothetical protein
VRGAEAIVQRAEPSLRGHLFPGPSRLPRIKSGVAPQGEGEGWTRALDVRFPLPALPRKGGRARSRRFRLEVDAVVAQR